MENTEKTEENNNKMETNIIVNKSGDINEYVFDLLMDIISKRNSNDYVNFRNIFTNDFFFMSSLEKSDNENTIVLYVLSKCIECLNDDRLLFNQDCYNWAFNSLFKKQFVGIDQQFYPILKTINNKKKILITYKQFKCVNFLICCLHRSDEVSSKLMKDTFQIRSVEKMRLIISEIEQQILNHISLIVTGLITRDCNVDVTDRRWTKESILLPFIIGNENSFSVITKLIQHTFSNSGLDSNLANGFFPIFGNVLMNLHHCILEYSVDSPNHEVILRTLYNLMTVKSVNSQIKFPIISMMTKLPNWTLTFVTDAKGQEFERLTFLGSFLSGSMFADDNNEVALNHYRDDNIDENQLSTIRKALQSRLDIVWEIQYQIVKLLLVDKSTHDITVDYLSRILCINSTRGHLQPDETIASSEGFISNVNAIIQRLVAPIKLDKIDTEFLTYFANSEEEYNLGKLLSDETRINVDKDTLLNQCNRLKLERPIAELTNFHTHCFYLSGICHHYGILASIRKQSRRDSAMQSLERNIKEITRMMEHNQFNAAQMQMSKATLTRYKSMVSFQKKATHCSEVVLYHDAYLRSTLEYFIQVAQLISSILNHDISTLNTLIMSVPLSFSCLPQFFFDDMADFLIFIISKRPYIFSFVNRLYDLTSFIMFMATHSHLIKSPYLVAKFVEVIFNFLPSVNNNQNLYPIFQLLISHYAVSSGFLTNRLISFYIDVEKTGATSEFYDKFSIRFKISIIFRTLWKQGSQMKIHLLNEVHDNLEKFVKFVNRAMNDMVYLLDESITALKRIRTNQEKKNDSMEWTKLSRQEQSTILQQLNHDERSTKSQLTLADVTVEMLYDFTQEIKEPFLCAELVDKLATMLNSFLLELVGSKCKDLKVNEPEKYHWNPKKLLQNLVRIYMNLDSAKLIEAISNDERFYSPKLFTDAISKLRMYNIIGCHELEHFDNFRQKIEDLVQERQIDDADLGDIPSEYLDPIMSSIMKDPVMLPKSKIVVDMSVIKRHLLNDDCDPFNRQPLKLEDLIPQPELQKEIQQWRLQKRISRKI